MFQVLCLCESPTKCFVTVQRRSQRISHGKNKSLNLCSQPIHLTHSFFANLWPTITIASPLCVCRRAEQFRPEERKSFDTEFPRPSRREYWFMIAKTIKAPLIGQIREFLALDIIINSCRSLMTAFGPSHFFARICIQSDSVQREALAFREPSSKAFTITPRKVHSPAFISLVL